MHSRDTDNNPSHHVRFREVFVGELGANDTLDWGGDRDEGNVPARLGPVFPRNGAVVDPFSVVIDWLRRGRASGRRVDWGAVALVVTRDDLHAFAVDCYGRERLPGALTDLILALDPQRRYALVASEG